MANLTTVLAASGKKFYTGKPISPEECQQQGLELHWQVFRDRIRQQDFAVFDKN